jgi:hypothetical protein
LTSRRVLAFDLERLRRRRGGTLERAAAIAGHASTRTTQLYDRRRELIEPEEIERVQF